MSSEDLVAYVAKAIKEALSRYDEARIKPLEKMIKELGRGIAQVRDSLTDVEKKVSILPVFEEKAIYQATRAVAEARITMQAKQLVKEMQEEMDYNKLIDNFIVPLFTKLRPILKVSLRDAISEVTLPVDKEAIYDTASTAVNEQLSKLEERFASIEGGLDEVSETIRHLEGVINALQQDIRALGDGVSKTRGSLEGVIRRVGKLEEEASKLRDDLESLLSRLEEALRGAGR